MASSVACHVLSVPATASLGSVFQGQASSRSSVQTSALRSGLRGVFVSRNANDKARVRSSPLVVRAVEETPAETVDSEKLVRELKEKWDKVENKPAAALYAGGAVVVVWLSSAIVGAISSVPLLPKFLELVGVGYTGWFVYRYLLFKSSRKELAQEVEELKSKITGATGLDE